MKIEIQYSNKVYGFAPDNLPLRRYRYKFIQNKRVIKEFFVDPLSNKTIVVASWGSYIQTSLFVENVEKYSKNETCY